MYSTRFYRQVLAKFGLDLAEVLTRVPPGSPNRIVHRVAVAAGGDRFVLAEVSRDRVPRKSEIARTVRNLRAAGLNVAEEHLFTADADPVAEVNETFWQVTRWVDAVDLPRPDWVRDAWRGDAIAVFLADLRHAVRVLPDAEPFSLDLFLQQLLTNIRRLDPQVLSGLREPVRVAQQALLQESDLPAVWMHGDVHPMNVLWGERSIRAVIDWEFVGVKADLYDVANLLGCIGVEEPTALAGPFVVALLKGVRAAGLLSEQSWVMLPAYTLALRFAWLSEWLRIRDREMVALESDLLRILAARQQQLAEAWS